MFALGTCVGSDPANDPLWGVIMRSGAFDNQIGPGNEIADNPGGVWIEDDATDGNTITRNSIHDNGGPGIVLTSPGANNGVAAPAITSATTGTVSGTACANCRVEIFRTNDRRGRRWLREALHGCDRGRRIGRVQRWASTGWPPAR